MKRMTTILLGTVVREHAQAAEILHQALGTKREDFKDEPGHWLRLVVVAHRGQRSNQNMSFWLGCASQDRMDVEMFRMATISGFFPHASDIKYVGTPNDSQQWGAISTFASMVTPLIRRSQSYGQVVGYLL